MGKIDYHLNDKNQIFGSLFVSSYDAVGEDRPFTNALYENRAPIRVWSNVDSWVYTPNSSWVNELRFGYDRMSFNFFNVDINTLADGKGYPINTGITNPGGMPTINVAPFFGGGAQLFGTNFNRPQFNAPNPYYDFQDAVSYLKGKHAFKFGFEFAHLEADTATYNYGRGLINFAGGQSFVGSTPLEDFFAGKPTNGIIEVGDPHRRATWRVTAGFIQDDWRVTPKVIVNLGLRYEYVSPMKMRNNAWASFESNAGLVQQGSGGLNTLWSGDHTGVEPRLGLAWDVTGKGTTVVRAGGRDEQSRCQQYCWCLPYVERRCISGLRLRSDMRIWRHQLGWHRNRRVPVRRHGYQPHSPLALRRQLQPQHSAPIWLQLLG